MEKRRVDRVGDPGVLDLESDGPVEGAAAFGAGVVGAVVPWNFPLTLAGWKVAPALAAGCTVVLKPSENSPLSALLLGRIATEAGLPPGVLNVVTGDGPTAGRALGIHPDVDVLAFTGSTAVGRHFLHYAADSNLKRVWLELGGKSPNIVLPDAPDLEKAAATAAWGIFFNQGEMCTAPSRLLVHSSIAEQVTEAVVRRARELRVGDPLDPATEMGALVSEAHLDSVLDHIATGQAEGARLRTGGKRALGNGLAVAAIAEDGTVEALELPSSRGWFTAVQWHPEDTASTDPSQQNLFDTLVRHAASG